VIVGFEDKLVAGYGAQHPGGGDDDGALSLRPLELEGPGCWFCRARRRRWARRVRRRDSRLPDSRLRVTTARVATAGITDLPAQTRGKNAGRTRRTASMPCVTRIMHFQCTSNWQPAAAPAVAYHKEFQWLDECLKKWLHEAPPSLPEKPRTPRARPRARRARIRY